MTDTADLLGMVHTHMTAIRALLQAPLPIVAPENQRVVLEADRQHRFSEAVELLDELFAAVRARHGEAAGTEVERGLGALRAELLRQVDVPPSAGAAG
jgi:hypothetical protein